MKRRLAIDPARVSKGCRELNPHLFSAHSTAGIGPIATDSTDVRASKIGKRRKQMNKIEAEFARILQAQMDREEIVSFDYEGLTLRWGGNDGYPPLKYTPDFVVTTDVVSAKTETEGSAIRLTFIEVKGAYAWQKDVVKFRAARAAYPLFHFEFWQKLDGEWQQTR